MRDDPSILGPDDLTRINVNEPYEFEYWMDHFAVTATQMKESIARVGVMVEDVEKDLKK